MANVMVILCVFTCEAKGQLVITIFSEISAPLINESLNVKHIGFCMIFDAGKKNCHSKAAFFTFKICVYLY